MGILSGVLGNASEVSVESVQKEFAPMLVDGEQIIGAYKLVRDMLVFTDRRLILVDKQGVSGKKVEYQTIPYRSIVSFSKESAGTFDLDAEFRIWVRGMNHPITKQFRKNNNVNDVYKLLSTVLLSD